MASNPSWCRSLPGWRSLVDTWLRRAEPQDIADLSVLLDFRVVHGESALAHELREHIHATLPQEPAVLYQLTRNALTFRPPTRLPGNIYLGGAAEHAGEIDLKDALMPIVTFARVYAARHRIAQTHTLERIDALAAGRPAAVGQPRRDRGRLRLPRALRLQAQLAATCGPAARRPAASSSRASARRSVTCCAARSPRSPPCRSRSATSSRRSGRSRSGAPRRLADAVYDMRHGLSQGSVDDPSQRPASSRSWQLSTGPGTD